jgi:hypothetical protein
MKTILATAALATLFAVSAPGAFADCADDIKAASDMVAQSNNFVKAKAASKQIAMAKDALSKNDDDACKTATDAAMAALGQ